MNGFCIFVMKNYNNRQPSQKCKGYDGLSKGLCKESQRIIIVRSKGLYKTQWIKCFCISYRFSKTHWLQFLVRVSVKRPNAFSKTHQFSKDMSLQRDQMDSVKPIGFSKDISLQRDKWIQCLCKIFIIGFRRYFIRNGYNIFSVKDQ